MSELDKLLEGVEVEYKTLGDTCDIKTGKGITKKDSSDSALYPIISGGKEPMGYYDKFNRVENTVTISRVGANSGYVSFLERKFYLNDKCFSVLPIEKYKSQIDSKFLFYILKTKETSITELQSEGGVPTINTTKVGSLSIPIPPLPIQKEIVRILDTFAELTAELTARKKQYNYYREQLLSFEDVDVEHLPMGNESIGKFIRGGGLQKKDFTESGVGCIHYGQIYTYYGTHTNKTKTFVSEEFAKKARKAKYGDLVVATTSETDEDVCKAVAWLGDEEIAVSSDACFYTHCLNPKYVAYFFQTEQFQKQKRPFITGTKVRRVNADDLAKIKIPVPSPEEQERIVSILDKFDILTTSISEGLPKEIELRKKQYEYYRDLLLTFPKSSEL